MHAFLYFNPKQRNNDLSILTLTFVIAAQPLSSIHLKAVGINLLLSTTFNCHS